jgi:hypothetical protein
MEIDLRPHPVLMKGTAAPSNQGILVFKHANLVNKNLPGPVNLPNMIHTRIGKMN